MIRYYQSYLRRKGDGLPRGIFVTGTYPDAMLWDYDQKAWVYDPWSIDEFRDKPENIDKFDQISREEAEALMLEITKGTEALPDEETILWIFQWKGAPPQDED